MIKTTSKKPVIKHQLLSILNMSIKQVKYYSNIF